MERGEMGREERWGERRDGERRDGERGEMEKTVAPYVHENAHLMYICQYSKEKQKNEMKRLVCTLE